MIITVDSIENKYILRACDLRDNSTKELMTIENTFDEYLWP